MKISDLLVEIEEQFGFKEKPLRCDLIALDAKTGKILFDTGKNKKEYVEKYHNAETSCLWADVRLVRGIFGDSFQPVMKCYVEHDSWLKESVEAGMAREKVCGTCKYNKGEPDGEKGYKDWYCNNQDSDCYGVSTAYSDTCKDWEKNE